MTFTHLDLFAGIGGFSRAVEWLGGRTVAFVEWEAWNRRVLYKHWPEARFYGDIRTVTADDISELGRIDLITGGYPCQPFSHAGKRLGTEDDRHLWPEMRRVIDIARPRYVLAENVAGHISMGLDLVLSELEADGYTGRAIVVPAAAVNALHRRDRVWIMAHRNESDGEARHTNGVGTGEPACTSACAGLDQTSFVSNPNSNGRHARGEREEGPEGAALGAAGASGELWTDSPQPLGRTAVVAGEHPTETVADAETRGIRRGRPSGNERQSAQCGKGVADATGIRCEPNRAITGGAGTGERKGWLFEPSGSGEGDASSASHTDPHSEPDGTVNGGPRSAQLGASHPGGRTQGEEAPRSVDAGADGISAGLVRRPAARSPWDDPDVIRAMWADGSWELDLPRVVSDEAERRQKLQAAGNAIVPLVAYEILRVMLADELVKD